MPVPGEISESVAPGPLHNVEHLFEEGVDAEIVAELLQHRQGVRCNISASQCNQHVFELQCFGDALLLELVPWQ